MLAALKFGFAPLALTLNIKQFSEMLSMHKHFSLFCPFIVEEEKTLITLSPAFNF
jgi:hypothetical protein